jgi:DNA-binding HxlR family transcriptional regulator
MSPSNTRTTIACETIEIQSTHACELRDVLDRWGDKWSLLVVELLDHSTRRFSELRQEIDGISQRMLTLTLRHLERDGLVRRTVYPVVPPRVEYELTPLGTTLLETIQPLVTWARAHRDEIAAARSAYDSSPRADSSATRIHQARRARRTAATPAPVWLK